MESKDTVSMIWVNSVTKDYGDRVKQVDFKKGRYIYRPGWSKKREWDYYYSLGYLKYPYEEYLERKNTLRHESPAERVFMFGFQLPLLEADPIQERFNRTLFQEAVVEPVKAQLAHTDDVERSLRRSKMSVKELGWCNDFDMFITFTFGKHHYNIERCIKIMNQWLKDQQKIQKQKTNQKFEYLLVMEYHKNRQGIHFHALFKGYTGRIKESVDPKRPSKPIKKNGKIIYNLPAWTAGFSTMSYVVDKQKSVTYLSKYITKDFAEVRENKKRYWCSRGLVRPSKFYNMKPQGEVLKTYSTNDFDISFIKTTNIGS